MGELRQVQRGNPAITVGTAAIVVGVVLGGIAALEYVDPSLFRDPADPAAIEASAVRDIIRACAAVALGVILVTVGRAQRRASAPAESAEATARAPEPEANILPAGDPLPPNLNGDGRVPADLAPQIWRARLAVDVQCQRLQRGGLINEPQVDAELYALALGSLLRGARRAQHVTRSVLVADAIETFRATVPEGDIVKHLEPFGTYHNGSTAKSKGKKSIDAPNVERSISVQFDEEGTLLELGGMTVQVARLTGAADALANTAIGELTGLRKATKPQNRARKVPVSKKAAAKKASAKKD